MTDNKTYGISVGHRDTDNLIRNCTLERNHQVGILFRKDGDDKFFGGHRNKIENCVIRDNGKDGKGFGIDIRWKTKDITIQNTRFESKENENQQTAIRIGKDTNGIILNNNSFVNCPVEIDDLRE